MYSWANFSYLKSIDCCILYLERYMHFSALSAGEAFAQTYFVENGLVVDVGGRNINGSLRTFFEKLGMRYICVDMEKDDSVDIVVPPGEPMPFEEASVDLIISTSCFEHDPCFWMTFREMTRMIKPTGFIYVNAPTRGFYHGYPGDNWRFYSDAGQALAFWSGKPVSNEVVYPVKVEETFHIDSDTWFDFVCVWKRTPVAEKTILVGDHLKTPGLLETRINSMGLKTQKKMLLYDPRD